MHSLRTALGKTGRADMSKSDDNNVVYLLHFLPYLADTSPMYYPGSVLFLCIVLMPRQPDLNGRLKVATCIKNPVFLPQNRNAVI